MIFQWDLAKDRANQKKHSVSFREAKELLSSEADFLEIFDDSHSADEERFIAIGPVHRGVIVVVWTERTEETIRIISARFATKKEKQLYREYMEKR
jgi:uncharacterized DUF497 family protein